MTAQDMAVRAQKYERIMDNLTSGRLSEVVADLPDDVAALLAKNAEEFMASDPDVKGSAAAAAHKVFSAWFGEGVPRRPLSPAERERQVTSALGEVYLSPTKEQAAKDREKLQTIDSLVLNLETMEKLVEPYRALGFQHVPEDVRGQIVTLGTVIAAQASQSLEMGVIQKWDAELWRDMSGEKLASWWRSMLTDRFESLRAFRTESKRRRLAFVKTLEQIAGPKFGIRDEQKVKDPDRAVRP